MRVEDDGVGFDESVVPSGHLGLTGMRARAEKIGGRLTVRSRAGHGTAIEVTITSTSIHAEPEARTDEPTVAAGNRQG